VGGQSGGRRPAPAQPGRDAARAGLPRDDLEWTPGERCGDGVERSWRPPCRSSGRRRASPSSSMTPKRARSIVVAHMPPSCMAAPRASQVISASRSAPSRDHTRLAMRSAIRVPEARSHTQPSTSVSQEGTRTPHRERGRRRASEGSRRSTPECRRDFSVSTAQPVQKTRTSASGSSYRSLNPAGEPRSARQWPVVRIHGCQNLSAPLAYLADELSLAAGLRHGVVRGRTRPSAGSRWR
jgi:hypothetical protein